MTNCGTACPVSSDTDYVQQAGHATLDHIAVAVKDIAQAARFFAVLGIEVKNREIVAEQGVEVAMLPIGACRLELLQPLADNSSVGRFIARHGEGIHHIAFTVDDIYNALERCRTAGYHPLNDKPRRGAERTLIAFLDPRTTSGVLIELIQKESGEY